MPEAYSEAWRYCERSNTSDQTGCATTPTFDGSIASKKTEHEKPEDFCSDASTRRKMRRVVSLSLKAEKWIGREHNALRRL
jgi:hypothetical protein